MRKIYLLLLTVCFAAMANGQVTVNVTNPTNTTPNLAASYTSLALALTDLNAVTAMTGPVTLTCVTGSETAPSAAGFTIGSATLNPVLSATNTVTINTSGGAVTLNAAAGGTGLPNSAVQDGILKIVGADYITIDGLTLVDGNAANPATMEFGIGLFKLSLSDGAQNNTIQNCSITLNRINNASSTAPAVEGSRGINVVNSTDVAQTTPLTPTTAAGTNSNNMFYANTIENCNYGIVLNGFAATTPFTAGDTGNDIGGLAPATGNTILNYGGAAAATNPAAGIRANNQWSINISYNTINNNNGSGVNHVTTLRGIYAQAGTSANATINNNTVTISSAATTSAATAIENVIGSTAASNTVNINNNLIQNCTYSTATTGTFTGILNGASAANVNMNGNTVNNCSVGTSGTASVGIFQGIYSSGTATNLSISNNTVTNNTINNQGGTIYCLRAGTSIYTVNGNTINNNSIPLAGGTSTSSIYGFYDLSSPTGENFQNNQINDLSITGATTSTTNIIAGIHTNTAAGFKTWTGNTIHTLTFSNSSTGVATVNGISSALSTTINVSKNKVYNLSAQGATSLVSGIIFSSTSTGGTATISNNLVGDLKAPTGNNGTTDNIRGINITATTSTATFNVYYNTIYLAASSTGANFTTSGLYHTTSTTATTAALNLRNNIIVNNSTPAGTGLAIAYRRSSGAASALNNYAATSNNNLFYAGTPGASNLIYSDGTSTAQTLAAYKSGVFTAGTIAPRDANSVTENPPFLSTTGSSANFLHIDPSIATQVESGAATVAGITDDFDGNVRNVTTPDIGADEGTFTLADFSVPSISYTPLGFTCATGNRTLTASITDASGVPTAGAGLPVLYWRINAGAWTAATGVFVSGSNYDFTFGSGVVTGDVVQYYIVAQDNAGTPNVGAFPSAGAAGFTINPPAAATAPTTPSSYSISNTLSGTYTVGAAGTYTTLTAAINAYNTSCLGGPVVFSLIDLAYTTTSDTIRANAYASAVNTLTIKPAATGTTITGNTTSATIVLLGADYVTIDGSVSSTANTVCPASSASRDLTISNTNAGTSSAVVSMNATAGGDAPTNNTVKNCIITGNTNTTTLVGINNSGTAMGSGAGSNFNNNNAIVNNSISRVAFGIFSAGSAVATKNSGTIINQNEMTGTGANSIGRIGIMSLFEDNITVSGNSISGIVSTASSDVGAIGIGVNGISTTTVSGGETSNATITHNVIGIVQQTNTFSAFGIAVQATTTGTTLIANNMLSGVNSNATSGDFSTGILAGGGTGSTTNIYYNTVEMKGTFTGADESSYALSIMGANPVVNVRNNILISTGTTGANRNRAIGLNYALPASNLTSDNNDLFVSGTGSVIAQTTLIDNTGGVNQTTFTDWQTNATQDANSKNVQPTFVSATNLHLVTPDAINFTNLESMGTAVSVTNDIDCQSRPNGSAPDIGADEFVGAAPSCNVPTAVSIGSITTTSASVSFTCTGCTGTYIVEYGAPGFVPGTGGSAGGGTIVTGAASPIAISPLTAATTYDVYVRQDCGAGSYSNNSTVVTFTTLCNTISLPYTENFDAVTPPAVPNCSLVEDVNGSTTWATAALNPNSAPNSLTYSYNTPLPGDDWWYTPGFNLTGGTSYRLTFSYRARLASFPEALEVKYGNGQNAGAMTSSAIFSNTNITNTTYSQATIDFTPGSSGVYYIGFHNISLADQFDLHVDDIGLDVTPACPAPAQPTMSAITSNSAIATWAGAATYILEYGPTGYTPGTGATAGAGGTLIDPAVSPQSITGLSGTTTYDLYVRQVCAGPSWSANSPVRTFTTLAAPPPNDEASGAILLTVGAGCTGATYTNVAATASANEPYPSCSGTKQSPVWFSFVAPASGAVRVSTDVGSGPTFTDSKLGLFSGTDLVGYTDFQIISCDDDGGSVVGSGFLSVVYATGLTPGTTYYIAADRYNSFTTNGTFCIAVDELNNSHLSTVTTCTTGQTPVSNSNTTYAGWAPLMDNSSRLIALVRNPAGGDVSLYSIAQNINAAAVRSASGVYYLDRNYRINNSSATNVDVQLFYLNSELTALALANPSTTAANLGASRQAGTVCQNDYSPVNGTPTFIAQTGNGVSTDGLVRWIAVTTPSFSNFYLQSSVGGTLPTGLLTFSGAKEGSVNKLRWTTSSEQNNSGFEVQRSTDGITFTAIGFVNSQAMGGNSSDALNYIFIDNNPVGDKQYYRLRQVDLDNRSKLSNIVMIKGNKPVTLAIGGLFPNPANSQINVILDAPVRDKVTLVVMDATGKTVIQQVVNVETGSNTIPVNISTLTNGTYLVKLVCNSNCESAVAKFVKQ